MPDDPARPEPVPSEELDSVFGALSHSARRKILVTLYARGGVMTAGEIAERFKCSWPTTTRHLAVLTDAGLLETGKQGRYRFYALRSSLATRSANWITSWSAEDHESLLGDGRPDWTRLDHATMRNATPPGK
jgi:DNA-binding transcriptional ArsR family regulator